MSSVDQPAFRFPNEAKVIVICGREDDAAAWRDLVGEDRCLAVPLDAAPDDMRRRTLKGASDQVTWQHAILDTIDQAGWLGGQVRTFDPSGDALLVLPDPLNPVRAGTRRRLGRRPLSMSVFEDKTVVDALWDSIGVPRAASIITDSLHDLAGLGRLVDRGDGVVCSVQPIGTGPAAGGDGIWWWRDSSPPQIESHGCRIRLMPLLPGTPVRLHGFVSSDQVVGFPPMEIVTLPRVGQGTFLSAGSVNTVGLDPALTGQTTTIGNGLRQRLDYRGGFSVDGILTDRGFVPTDLNARLTSAMESTPSHLRVCLHAANLLARHGVELDHDQTTLLAQEVFRAGTAHTLYGAAKHARADAPAMVLAKWEGSTLIRSADQDSDVSLTLTRSMRGWLLTATLATHRLPAGLLGPLAPAVFAYSDQAFGTEFGDLAPPFAATGAPIPPPRRYDSAQPGQRHP